MSLHFHVFCHYVFKNNVFLFSLHQFHPTEFLCDVFTILVRIYFLLLAITLSLYPSQYRLHDLNMMIKYLDLYFSWTWTLFVKTICSHHKQLLLRPVRMAMSVLPGPSLATGKIQVSQQYPTLYVPLQRLLVVLSIKSVLHWKCHKLWGEGRCIKHFPPP